DRDAVRFSGTALTYGELADRSRRLSRVLLDLGVRRGDRVGILLEKSLDVAVAIYGILRAGAAYVPLDPLAPPARSAFVLRDCGVRVLVSHERRRARLAELASETTPLERIVGLDAPSDLPWKTVSWDEVLETPPGPAAMPRLTELDLAYVLYTSGSTGVPKGILHTHRSALSFANVARDTYGFVPDDRISNHAPLHFDLSTLDWFATAAAGATTIVVPEAVTKLPASLARLMEDERLTVLYCVPLALVQLALRGAIEMRDLGSLRWVLFGGEPMPPKHLRALMRLLRGARFSNVYGPTETNGCTYWIVPPIPEGSDESIPIGVPYENVEMLVVGRDGEVVPRGQPGELLVRSPTLMRGYWGRPDLDEKAFYRRPAFGHLADVFHRTGDLVIEDENGVFHFLGRKDRQVKVRGHRVELDEVEAVLLSHEGLAEAAAFTEVGDDGSVRVAAAAIPRDLDSPPSVESLRAHCASRLPHYAVPETFRIERDFPRTSTGKIDRRRLAERGSEDETQAAPLDASARGAVWGGEASRP
ncbi:MAG TPA: amino acid adenylation domain-containing protein, partial [Planctomycetota bacterium]|nr:amino acid adenylation domain-containing protein [Planctomycetota bacterium]